MSLFSMSLLYFQKNLQGVSIPGLRNFDSLMPRLGCSRRFRRDFYDACLPEHTALRGKKKEDKNKKEVWIKSTLKTVNLSMRTPVSNLLLHIKSGLAWELSVSWRMGRSHVR